MSRSISAVLPNYNGRDLLERNLPSLVSALQGMDSEIIIVDDCSNDDSVAFVQSHYPEIKLVQNSTNMGFSHTCNRGIMAAGCDLVAVINTDVTFTTNYFSELMGEFEDPEVFAVKGDIINYANTIDEVINIERTSRLYYKRGFLRFDNTDPLTERAVFSGHDDKFVALGCCFVADRKILKELGGFDEVYSPYYWEDSDLARRAMEAGYKLVYLPSAIVYHQLSSTIGTYRGQNHRKLVSNRNKIIFTWRHLDPHKNLLPHASFIVLNLLTRWLLLDWRFYAALSWALVRLKSFKGKHP